MVWQKVPGVVGKVFRPDIVPGGKKGSCTDCYCCQGCSRERCRLCRVDTQDADRPSGVRSRPSPGDAAE